MLPQEEDSAQLLLGERLQPLPLKHGEMFILLVLHSVVPHVGSPTAVLTPPTPLAMLTPNRTVTAW